MLSLSLYPRFAGFKRIKLLSYFVLCIPTIVFYIIDPAGQAFLDYLYQHRINHRFFTILFIWSGLYILTAAGLLVLSTISEKNPIQKKENLKLIVVFLPVFLLVFIIGYSSPLIFKNAIYQTLISVLITLMTTLLLITTLYGFSGIKLTIDRYYYESSKKTLHTGISFINHSIKNELQNLTICAEILHTASEREKLNAIANTISGSTRHILTILNRVGEQTKEVVLEKKVLDLSRIIQECLSILQPYFTTQRIIVTYHPSHPLVTGDVVYLKEVFINIFKNAIEAIGNSGQLTIETIENQKVTTIVIHDTGRGISKKDLPRVFEPFFTTKGQDEKHENYGLGLSYCQTVMKKHGGKIAINSEENQGTTVFLSLPNAKV